MLATAGTDIKRMQEAIDSERERTKHLTDEYLKRMLPTAAAGAAIAARHLRPADCGHAGYDLFHMPP